MSKILTVPARSKLIGGGARLFDAAQEQSLDAPIVDDFPSQPMSLSCWFRLDVFNENQTITGLYTSTNISQYIACLYAGSEGNLMRLRYGSKNLDVPLTLSAGQWVHVVCSLRGTVARTIYINGEYAGFDASYAAWPSAMNRLSLGRHGDSTPSNWTTGAIANVSYWQSELLADDVKALWNGGRGLDARLLTKRYNKLFANYLLSDNDKNSSPLGSRLDLSPGNGPTWDKGPLFQSRTRPQYVTVPAEVPQPSTGVRVLAVPAPKKTVRPTHFKLDRNNGLYKGLVFAYLGAGIGGELFRDSSPYLMRTFASNLGVDSIEPELQRSALDFNGSSNYAAFGDIDHFPQPSDVDGECSVALWLKIPTWSNYQRILLWSEAVGANQVRTSGVSREIDFLWYAPGFGSQPKDEVLLPSLNEWHHVCFTKRGSEYAGYVNGKLASQPPEAAVGSDTKSGALYIGQRGNGAYYRGQLTDVMIYNRVLSLAEIRQLATRKDASLGGLIGERSQLITIPTAAPVDYQPRFPILRPTVVRGGPIHAR